MGWLSLFPVCLLLPSGHAEGLGEERVNQEAVEVIEIYSLRPNCSCNCMLIHILSTCNATCTWCRHCTCNQQLRVGASECELLCGLPQNVMLHIYTSYRKQRNPLTPVVSKSYLVSPLTH